MTPVDDAGPPDRPEVFRLTEPFGPSGDGELGGLCDLIRDTVGARDRLRFHPHGDWYPEIDRPRLKRYVSQTDTYPATISLDARLGDGWDVRVTRTDRDEQPTVTEASNCTREEAYIEAATLARKISGCSTK